MPESSSHPMPAEQLGELLQILLSAERAGAKVAGESLRQSEDDAQRALLQQILQGEGDSCRHLLNCLNHLGLEPNRDTGAFYAKAMAIEPLEERLQFVDRGQQWVIRTLREHLPGCDDALIRAELEEVLRIHEQNSAAAHN
ncbi:DUF6306 domain-containing protein [Geopseudomonas guangdongensis]|uniref:DUF6306 domain-containing protein n=1 Tax=Geopseudomonas guangdongensis TaxID=1245526 RepID=A0A1H2ICS8_9GAMM|nr:DUF6306 domain-containing protein [Pseudomonas guangdongensis]SDU41883.1 hypothetical protein SAMN05216580_2903 [Pseudomonas guangdongensis]